MRPIFFIISLLLFSFVILMPPKVQIGRTSLYRPQINLNILSRSFVRDLEFRLGLDLQGGTHLVYQADISRLPPSDVASAVSSTRDNIDRRVNLLGLAEPLIQTSRSGDDHRIIVELPGIKNVQDAIATIGVTAQLDFRETASASAATPEFIRTDLTGADLKRAQIQFSSASNATVGEPTVSLEFTPDGAKKFAEITKRNIDKPLAIFLDDRIITAPVVRDAIPTGQAVISGDFTLEDAKRLTIQLNAGALPVPIHLVEQRTIGATLGSESILKSLVAGAVGLMVIYLFMVSLYGPSGLLASLALTLYVLVSLSLFKLIPVTLTLAGIAGFILSVGMAVDANILIFERIKEEICWGRPKKAALELGFHRAWTSIRDSNVSSLITASILFWFGSGSVRGFAMTLIIGILVSLFTSITISRQLLRMFYSKSK